MNGIIISFTQFKEVDFIIRSPHSHKQHCLELEHNTNASKEYGINRNSCLNELRYNLNGFNYTHLHNSVTWLYVGTSMFVMED